MRNITAINANDDWSLDVSFDDGAHRQFDVKPLLDTEAFTALLEVAAKPARRVV